MARLNKIEQARRDGFDYFVNLYKRQAVRIPELDEEIKRRGLTGKPVGVDKQAELDFCAGIRLNTLETVLILTEFVLHDKFGFGRERLNRFKEYFNNAADAMDRDYISWGDVRAVLERETGVKTEIHWFGKPVKNEELTD